MPVTPKVTITLAERAALVDVMQDLNERIEAIPDIRGDLHGARKVLDKRRNSIDTLLAKYDRASLPKPRGVDMRPLVAVANDVLGCRLIVPPSGAGGVWGAMNRRVTDLGLTPEQFERACIAASKEWRGTIRLESLVRQADKLLSEATDPTAAGAQTSEGFSADWETIE